MLGAFAQAFRTPDLRRKLLFTLFIMAAFRLGSFIPTPGVDSQAVQRCMAQESQASLLDLVNLFSGGALLQLSIFALGIMPLHHRVDYHPAAAGRDPRFDACTRKDRRDRRS